MELNNIDFAKIQQIEDKFPEFFKNHSPFTGRRPHRKLQEYFPIKHYAPKTGNTGEIKIPYSWEFKKHDLPNEIIQAVYQAFSSEAIPFK